jgi:hypothetical protein
LDYDRTLLHRVRSVDQRVRSSREKQIYALLTVRPDLFFFISFFNPSPPPFLPALAACLAVSRRAAIAVALLSHAVPHPLAALAPSLLLPAPMHRRCSRVSSSTCHTAVPSPPTAAAAPPLPRVPLQLLLRAVRTSSSAPHCRTHRDLILSKPNPSRRFATLLQRFRGTLAHQGPSSFHQNLAYLR